MDTGDLQPEFRRLASKAIDITIEEMNAYPFDKDMHVEQLYLGEICLRVIERMKGMGLKINLDIERVIGNFAKMKFDHRNDLADPKSPDYHRTVSALTDFAGGTENCSKC